MTPDGTRLYVASPDDDSLTTFTRDAGTGHLVWAGCVSNSGSAGLCADGTGDERRPAISVAPDGGTVYLTAGGAGALDSAGGGAGRPRPLRDAAGDAPARAAPGRAGARPRARDGAAARPLDAHRGHPEVGRAARGAVAGGTTGRGAASAIVSTPGASGSVERPRVVSRAAKTSRSSRPGTSQETMSSAFSTGSGPRYGRSAVSAS